MARPSPANTLPSKPASASSSIVQYGTPQQEPHVGELTVALGSERGGQVRAGAALDQDHEPQQRVAELQPVTHPLGVAPGDRLLVRRVQQGPVDRPGPQAPPEGAGLAAVGDGPGKDLEQVPQRGRPIRRRGRDSEEIAGRTRGSPSSPVTSFPHTSR